MGDRAHEDLLHRFAEQSTDMIYRAQVSPVRRWEYLSAACLELTGYSVEEHCADPSLALRVIHPEDHCLYLAALDEAGDQPRTLVARWLHKDGTQRWIEERFRFDRDPAGALAVEGIARDITARKRVEALLAESQRLAQIGSWEWLIDRDELRWSEELHRIHGVAPGAAPATVAEFLATVAPEDRALVDEVARRALAERRPFSCEHRIVRPDGEVRHLQVRGDVFCDPLGRPLRVTGTSQDVTERRRLEARVLAADRIASLGILAGGIAHEINNPLTFLCASVELLRRELSAPGAAGRSARIDHLLENLQHGYERIARIVGDLRLYARGDDGGIGPVEIPRVVQLAVDLTRNEVRHRGQLVVDLATDLPPIEGNEVRLNQVLVNLIVNAAQATPEGAVADHEIRVVGRRGDRDRVVIEVCDTGVGITPELRDRIFDPFVTTKRSGTGTGLGLTICQGLVSSMGGQIQIESEPGRGSTFRVLLRSAERAVTKPERTTAPDLGVVRLLIVDDEARVAASLADLLASDRVVVATADGPAARARFARGERFDAILCDVMMPEVSGIDLYSELVRTAPDQARRVVFMTGGAFTPRAVDFLQSVPNPCLEKPFAVADLEHILAGVLQDDPP